MGSLIAGAGHDRPMRYHPTMGRKLHIGGHVRMDGWEILDANPGPHVDHVADARDLRCFDDDTFDEIYASHMVEHLDYKDELVTTLSGWRRVMMPGGTLSISVPDLDVLASLFLDPSLSLLERFTVMRMIFGGHVDRFDYHLAGLNEEFVRGFLGAAGFVDAKRVARFELFDDASKLEMRGKPISLNMVAHKAARTE
jgi:predicted SAM-dependent methyltransferase